MRTKAKARQKAENIVSDWVAGSAFTGWIPGSTIFLAGGDMIMIRQVADAFGVGLFDEAAVKAHLTGVVASSVGGILAGEALNFIPIFGQIAKAGLMAGKAHIVGKEVIKYFQAVSPLAD